MTHIDPTTDDYAVLRDILDLAEPRRHPPTVDVVTEILRRLEMLLRSEGVAFHAMDSRDFTYQHMQEVVDGTGHVAGPEDLGDVDIESEGCQILVDHWWTEPCSLIERTGSPVVTSIREHYGQRRWAQHPVRLDYLPFDDEIILGYPDGPGKSLRLLAGREGGPAFGDRELTICRLLLPWLRDVLAAVVAPPPPPDGCLTERQVEILHLVELGMSNREIGEALAISATTVRTHLEHAFERLGVTTRLAAVTAAFGGPLVGAPAAGA
ncbi:helix-turn-helix transcriptional regulator [Isoptericola haloaureus]|uniref:Helix-turn-helix transcriptional regulator n=1 Tax=Isoptericola haloaureus TaxID=1542902 RepID=A0ABU7Z781_9MICO